MEERHNKFLLHENKNHEAKDKVEQISLKEEDQKPSKNLINPLTSPGEGVTVFTSPYLSAWAPSVGEAKGLINFLFIILEINWEL